MLVSVIIPAYNAGKYITNAVRSALEQENLAEDEREVIVINDCSSDHTKIAMEDFVRDPKSDM